MNVVNQKPVSLLERSRLNQIDHWNEIKGDESLRLNYDLNSNSIVFDIGGFEGNWAAEIHARYGASVLVFEPYMSFYSKLESRFLRNPKIKTFPFGLGSANTEVTFYGGGDRSSVFKMTDIALDDDKGVQVQIVDIAEFIENNQFKNIDLIKLNIEGGEYDLLERLIEKKILNIFQNLQIQFHDIDESSASRMSSIQHELSKTHQLTYQYEFIWENWVKKDS